MSRYIERAENVARFIDVNLSLMIDIPSEIEEQWGPLIDTTGDHDLFEEHYDEADREKVIKFLTFDEFNPNSIYSCLKSAWQNAKSVREVITSDMWVQINTFYHRVNDAIKDGRVLKNPRSFYTKVKLGSHLFNGITDGTMSHGEGWHFSRLGRQIERADKTSRILDVKYYILLPKGKVITPTLDNIQWFSLLKSASALHMYKVKYQKISPHNVLKFLVLDYDFPRSIFYCVKNADISLSTICNSPSGVYKTKSERYLGKLFSELKYTNTDEILSFGMHEYFDRIQAQLNDIGNYIYEDFFDFSSRLEQVDKQAETQQQQ